MAMDWRQLADMMVVVPSNILVVTKILRSAPSPLTINFVSSCSGRTLHIHRTFLAYTDELVCLENPARLIEGSVGRSSLLVLYCTGVITLGEARVAKFQLLPYHGFCLFNFCCSHPSCISLTGPGT